MPITADLKKASEHLVQKITALSQANNYRLMEVCGTHTMAISRFGISKLLPENIDLLSGPGCPVCVTPISYIDQAIEYANMEDACIATFGDMLRVPGSYSSLEKEKSNGRNITVVYSPKQAVDIAKQNRNKKVIFLGIGFETTAPSIAASILEAKESNLDNYLVYCANKTIPPALRALVNNPVKIDGFILPGHVSTIIGSKAYDKILQKAKLPGVVCGFEPLDILQAIAMLLELINKDKDEVQIQYKRAVDPGGNDTAIQILKEVMKPTDSYWRGIGVIKRSGLKIRKRYQNFDATFVLGSNFRLTESKNNFCRCGEVLQGLIKPVECPLFAKACNPESPVGPCMVSSEGSCSAHFKYGKNSSLRGAEPTKQSLTF